MYSSDSVIYTPRPRSRGCTGAGGPRGAIPHPRSGAAAKWSYGTQSMGGCDSAQSMAERSYPSSEVRGGGGAAQRRYPASEVRGCDEKSYPASKVRSGDERSYLAWKVRGSG